MALSAQEPAGVVEEHTELLRAMLEDQFAAHTRRLTELTVYARLPGHGGYEPQALETLAAAARQGIADTAQALRRMTDGSYGVCERCGEPIPLGRLKALPHARYCAPCQRHQT
ncbi:TraR/DksA family transcriptional regulator [Micromonospora globbae]|jgi:DnaK suppressor protein|uniref:TraR/DksA family transcriptional regulator n=1 Tax=Micromonospora globbae TaxID=1894969 RepID=A0A420F1V8_9ACTN|nr:TraR/DksA family transcriptional regulator [Micromonospora globbae]RKF26497.1 TraR/DksA family transcriptional regulator [Micromonospora globbae]